LKEEAGGIVLGEAVDLSADRLLMMMMMNSVILYCFSNRCVSALVGVKQKTTVYLVSVCNTYNGEATLCPLHMLH
jgi:hypothetical protein